jgi:hypothetical protein
MNDLAKLGEQATGEVFFANGEIWLCVGYLDQPAASLVKLDGSDHGTFILNAPIAEPFKHVELPDDVRDWFWNQWNNNEPE